MQRGWSPCGQDQQRSEGRWGRSDTLGWRQRGGLGPWGLGPWTVLHRRVPRELLTEAPPCPHASGTPGAPSAPLIPQDPLDVLLSEKPSRWLPGGLRGPPASRSLGQARAVLQSYLRLPQSVFPMGLGGPQLPLPSIEPGALAAPHPCEHAVESESRAPWTGAESGDPCVDRRHLSW